LTEIRAGSELPNTLITHREKQVEAVRGDGVLLRLSGQPNYSWLQKALQKDIMVQTSQAATPCQ